MKWAAAALACALLLAQVSSPFDEASRLYNERRFREAAVVLERTQPADRKARLLLGLCWQQAGELNKAESVLQETARLESDWPDARYALARVQFMRGRFVEALANARAARDLGEPAARVWHLIGRIEEERGRFNQALAAYREAIHSDSMMAEARAGEGSVLFKLGQYAQAKTSAETALRLDPASDEARRILEQVKRASGSA
ncbi:MAG: tetratricopeptide repeat protein, partial [Bryobacteraceae bacterium]